MGLRKIPPKVGMKVQFPFQVSICCWVDLLGYGAEIRAADYNPLHPQAKAAANRIRQFHQVVANHSARTFPTLVMNDGAAAYYDLSYRTRWPTYDFVQRAFRLFEDIGVTESALGEPGARMVIAAGFRLRGRVSQSNVLRGQYVKSLLSRVETGEISVQTAVTRASQFRRTFDLIPHLQANFAFTRAYVAEQSGTDGGLPGPACYVDGLLFDSQVVSQDYLKLGKEVCWKSDKYGMAANFHELQKVRLARQTEVVSGTPRHHGPEGFRDALEVAQLLTGDANVLSALRDARTMA